jgi:parvulin-like peptidyl-prolyl isomerase
MMTKLREYSKIFIIIVALSFIGLMVFEWGMDYTGISSRRNVVGEVNGKELTYERFSELYQQLYQSERARREQEMTEGQLENLRKQVWDNFVQRILFQEEMDKLEIAVTDSEIVYQIRNYPLDEIKQNEGFQTDGEFDWNKYYASFTNPQIPWLQIEEFYRQNLPFQKLQNIITSTVRVSESEVEEEFKKNNQTVKLLYIEVPYSKFRETETEISDAEALEYYNDRVSDYHREEMRSLDYVMFPLTPSSKDTQRVMTEFEEIRERVAAGEDFNELALEYSEDPAKESNQGRYDFFERGAMVKPFEEASFNGTVGELVGPVETQYGLHLIMIEDKRIHEGEEQVKVSHILLKIVAGPSTREKQENAAALFAEDAREMGFESMAENKDLKIEHISNISATGNFVPGFGRNYQIYNFTFRNELGTVSDVLYTEKGFAVFKLIEIMEEGPQPFQDVKNVVINRIKLDRQKELARDFASQIQAKIDNGIDFASIAEQDTSNSIKVDSTSDFSQKSSVPGIGLDHIFNATAFSLQPGQISGLIETNRGLYWQKLLDKTEFDSSAYSTQKESIRQRLLMQKRNQAFTNWYEYLKEHADIVDNRKMFSL